MRERHPVPLPQQQLQRRRRGPHQPQRRVRELRRLRPGLRRPGLLQRLERLDPLQHDGEHAELADEHARDGARVREKVPVAHLGQRLPRQRGPEHGLPHGGAHAGTDARANTGADTGADGGSHSGAIGGAKRLAIDIAVAGADAGALREADVKTDAGSIVRAHSIAVAVAVSAKCQANDVAERVPHGDADRLALGVAHNAAVRGAVCFPVRFSDCAHQGTNSSDGSDQGSDVSAIGVPVKSSERVAVGVAECGAYGLAVHFSDCSDQSTYRRGNADRCTLGIAITASVTVPHGANSITAETKAFS